MNIKPGVEIDKLHLDLAAQLPEIEKIFTEYDSLFTITGGHEGTPSDGVHLPTSHHYMQNYFDGCGGAVDIRMRHLNYITMCNIEAAVRAKLGPKFDVVLEIKDKMGNNRNHLHCELH